MPIPSTYVVRPGDSLTSIAARVYRDPMYWVDLAKLNDLRDPRFVKAGQVIRLVTE
jgi:nucleoid-associated protein YgaU